MHSSASGRTLTRTLDCYAIVTPGLERLVAGELGALGINGEIGMGGVSFRAGIRELYQANLHLRVASRILVRVAEFRATAFWELEKRAKAVRWSDWLAPGRGIVFRVTSKKSKLYHQDGIADRLAGAASVAVRGTTRADDEGAQEFVVRVFRDTVTLSIDSSGELLHRRGYRLASARAPLRENLGAAAILGAGWDPALPLVDPFAGAGTIPIEAALIARRIPPGWRRTFGFEQWPDFDAALWRAVRSDAESQMLPRARAVIAGSDRDAGAIAAAEANAGRAGVSGDIEWTRTTFSNAAHPEPAGWLVTNPPYGVRVGEVKPLRDLYATLGQLSRGRYGEWTVAFLAADAGLMGATGVPFQEILRFRNGGIPVSLVVRRAGVSS